MNSFFMVTSAFDFATVAVRAIVIPGAGSIHLVEQGGLSIFSSRTNIANGHNRIASDFVQAAIAAHVSAASLAS